MSNIKLQSAEGEVFEVDVATAKVSGVLKIMLDLMGLGDEEEFIRFPTVSSKILRKVIEWATHHREEDGVGSENVEARVVDGTEMEDDSRLFNNIQWEMEFFKEDLSTLYELFKIAEYLDIPKLEKDAWDTFQNMARGKPIEELCAIFNITREVFCLILDLTLQ